MTAITIVSTVKMVINLYLILFVTPNFAFLVRRPSETFALQTCVRFVKSAVARVSSACQSLFRFTESKLSLSSLLP